MRDKKLNDQELDNIGQRLLESARPDPEEMERMLASNDLFHAVRVRIETGRHTERAPRSVSLSSLNWRISAGALTAAALLVSVFALASVYQTKTQPVGVVSSPVHTVSDRIVSSDNPLPPVEFKPEHPVPSSEPITQHAVLKTRVRPAEQAKPVHIEEVSEFYPLTSDYDPSDDSGAQLVRAEIPRSTLMTMGVETPFENGGSRAVKTDLLIGSDGVMKAVRFVK
jgi:hypothetical protein